MKGLVRKGVIAAIAALTLLGVGAAPAQAADYTFSCAIGLVGYYPCASDNYSVAPGHKVYIALTSSGGKGVYFQVYNYSGHHLLSSPNVKQSPDGSFYFYWTNNTTSNITVDVYADASAIVNVYAVAKLRII